MTPSPPSLRREKLRERRDCFWLDFDDARTSLFTEKDKVLNFVGGPREEIQIEFEDIEYTRVYLAREKIRFETLHTSTRSKFPFCPPPKGFEEWNHREYLSKDKYVCEHNWTKNVCHILLLLLLFHLSRQYNCPLYFIFIGTCARG